jgi:GT2 family glycosyltransferase/glycosyltransferase involved in cell wall biosynthesis
LQRNRVLPDDTVTALSAAGGKMSESDVAHACAFALGRAPSVAELGLAVRLDPKNYLAALLCSDEFVAFVGEPLQKQRPFAADRFRQPPSPDVSAWLADNLPLLARNRAIVAAANDWHLLYRLVLTDEVFCGFLDWAKAPWSASALSLSLSKLGTRTAHRIAHSSPAKSTATPSLDEAARALLWSLPPECLAILFDCVQAEDLSLSPHDRMDAYFEQPASERTSPCSVFDTAFYLGRAGAAVKAGEDPFCHFLLSADDVPLDPHPLIRMAFVKGDGDPEHSVIERMCALLSGEEPGSVHPLLDLDYIGEQLDTTVSMLEALEMFGDPATPLAIAPHPLFLPDYYRRRNAVEGRNELLHYVGAESGALLTHPLVSPSYIDARLVRLPKVVGTLLERYLQSWPWAPVNPSLFVDLKFLNGRLGGTAAAGPGEPLSRALKAADFGLDMIHPYVDRRVLSFAFGLDLDLEPDAEIEDGAAPLIAALDRPAPLPVAGQPRVSVVMPTYFKPAYTALSVLAAANALRSLPYEIVIIENGGDLLDHEELLRLFAPYPSVHMTKMSENRFFGEASNIGAEQSKGEYILFLNNDCFLAPDFGERLDELLSSDAPKIEAIGATLLFPNGDIQEFGGSVDDAGQVTQTAKHLPGSYVESLPALASVGYSSAACLCLSRQAFERVAGFDPLFEPFYYEDADLCRRLKLTGIPIHVARDLQATHIENVSTRDFLGSGFDDQVGRSRRAFAHRWLMDGGKSVYLRPEHSPAPEPKPKRALVWTPFDITPGGGERYLLSAARVLSETHEVVISSPRRMSRARVEFACHLLGIAPFAFTTQAASRPEAGVGAFDVAFVLGNEIVPTASPQARLNLFCLQFPFPWRNVGAFDFDRLLGFDTIMVYSPYAAQWTQTRLSEAGVRNAPPIEIVQPPVQAFGPGAPRAPLAGRAISLVNIGRFYEGAGSKRQDIFLEVIRCLRGRGLKVTGTLFGPALRSAEHDRFYAKVRATAEALGGIRIIREAGRQELLQTLSNTDVYLHCTGFGVDVSLGPQNAEHYGMTVVEAIQAGCFPVVVDNGGPPDILQQAGYGAVYRTVIQAADAIQAWAELGEDRPIPAWPGEPLDKAFDDWFRRRIAEPA